MISLPDLENLVKTRMVSKQSTSRYFENQGMSLTIGTKSFKGIPVNVRFGNDHETRWFDEVPNARELKEIVEFLSARIIVKQIHDS